MSSNNFFGRCRMKLVLVSSIHLSGDISESSEEKSDATLSKLDRGNVSDEAQDCEYTRVLGARSRTFKAVPCEEDVHPLSLSFIIHLLYLLYQYFMYLIGKRTYNDSTVRTVSSS